MAFNLNDFKKLIPYANKWNTYVMSEYNDVYGYYDFPIGIGKGQLGLLFEYNFKFIKQKTIKNPYAFVYIHPSPTLGVHSKYCFLSYLEMICKKVICGVVTTNSVGMKNDNNNIVKEKQQVLLMLDKLISNEKNEVHGGFTKQMRGWLDGFINNGWDVGVMVLNGQKEILEK